MSVEKAGNEGVRLDGLGSSGAKTGVKNKCSILESHAKSGTLTALGMNLHRGKPSSKLLKS